MRFVVLLLSVLLVSCATPKTAPQAYYGGVYAPGKIEFSSNGSFESTAGVFSADDLATARKAAYARLMVAAKSKGYRSFKITLEKTSSGIGKTFRLKGRAYKSESGNANIYPVDAIKRLLNGLPLAEPKPVVKSKPQRAPVRKVAKKPAPKPVETQPVPVTEQVPTEEPTVIMAPEDITGSIKKVKVPGEAASAISTGTGIVAGDIPSLSNVPKGYVLRAQ